MDKNAYEMNMIRWTDTIQRCRDSGMSIRSWCTQNNINEKNSIIGNNV